MQVLEAADLRSTSLPLIRNTVQYTDPEAYELIDLVVFFCGFNHLLVYKV
mgnify:CR=1 FL=1